MAEHQTGGYLALPESGGGPGVLVLHAWWGLNDTVRSVCDRLAGHGFSAYAPDLYAGKVVDTVPQAEALAGAVFENLDRARADVAGAATYLRQQALPSENGLALIGFSLGAFFALDLSVQAPELVRSVVAFYGTRPGDYSASRAAYLGHFAERDEFEPPSEVEGLEAALRAAGRPVRFHQYPGTGHWFFEPDRADAFQPQAAQQAWERTLAFLKA
jgi:carboxymethylenebutenolidase